MTTRLARSTVAVLAGVLAVLVAAAPAAAHVELVQAQANGDGTTTLTFGFEHGCEQAPTTELVVALPEGVTAARFAGTASGWTGTINGDRVRFTGPAIATGTAARFHVVTRIKAAVGQTLIFPAIQHCTGGATSAWIDRTADAEHPAPRVVATAAMLAEQAAAVPPAAVPPKAAAPRDAGAGLPQALAGVAVFVLLAGVGGGLAARRPRVGGRPAGGSRTRVGVECGSMAAPGRSRR
ncbi:DUF1775 domain-containing protein [Catellatospora vulcania]|uniref:DUF1775 domain-containing protein n=1 Tax=Catellatospora vulcania TaxID=1460450 RepID=UPI0012D3A71C|nr:DUF1775 domain-containing protein [Catellatospora vulcania]